MSRESSNGGGDVIIRRRTVDRDVTIRETEVEVGADDLDFDLEEFQRDLGEKMDEATENANTTATKDADGDATDIAIRQMVEEETDGEPEDEPEGSEDEPEESEDDDDGLPISPEEAANRWSTTDRNSFNSGCLSKEPKPQLGMAECSTLWDQVVDAGLVEEADEDDESTTTDDGDDTDNGQNGGEQLAEQLDADIDPESVEGAFLVVRADSDAGQAARDQFSDYIDSGALEVAEYFNSPKAADIRDAVEGELDTPELVLKNGDGYHVI